MYLSVDSRDQRRFVDDTRRIPRFSRRTANPALNGKRHLIRCNSVKRLRRVFLMQGVVKFSLASLPDDLATTGFDGKPSTDCGAGGAFDSTAD